MGVVGVTLVMLVMTWTARALPPRFPLLPPAGTPQQQQLALQEQMLAIQQFQALQQFNMMPSPLVMNPQQPLLILLPNIQPNVKKDDRITTKTEPNGGFENDDSDSITIDAEPDGPSVDRRSPVRAVLLVPDTARFSIGSIISGIPFLPIEINVPDSISWIYEGISGIISGLGQRWPFNRPQTTTTDGENQNTKSIWKDLNTRNMPIVVVPLGRPMLPMQL